MKLSIRGLLVAALVVAVVVPLASASADRGHSGGHHDKARFKALIFTKTAAFRHTECIPQGTAKIGQLAGQHNFDVDATEDANAFNDANLAKYDVVIFLCTTGDVLNDDPAGGVRALHPRRSRLRRHPLGVRHRVRLGVVRRAGRRVLPRPPGHASTRSSRWRRSTSRTATARRRASSRRRWTREEEWYNFRTNPRHRRARAAVGRREHVRPARLQRTRRLRRRWATTRSLVPPLRRRPRVLHGARPQGRVLDRAAAARARARRHRDGRPRREVRLRVAGGRRAAQARRPTLLTARGYMATGTPEPCRRNRDAPRRTAAGPVAHRQSRDGHRFSGSPGIAVQGGGIFSAEPVSLVPSLVARNPEDLHRSLRSARRARGPTLSDLILAELPRLANKPSGEQLLARSDGGLRCRPRGRADRGRARRALMLVVDAARWPSSSRPARRRRGGPTLGARLRPPCPAPPRRRGAQRTAARRRRGHASPGRAAEAVADLPDLPLDVTPTTISSHGSGSCARTSRLRRQLHRTCGGDRRRRAALLTADARLACAADAHTTVHVLFAD